MRAGRTVSHARRASNRAELGFRELRKPLEEVKVEPTCEGTVGRGLVKAQKVNLLSRGWHGRWPITQTDPDTGVGGGSVVFLEMLRNGGLRHPGCRSPLGALAAIPRA